MFPVWGVLAGNHRPPSRHFLARWPHADSPKAPLTVAWPRGSGPPRSLPLGPHKRAISDWHPRQRRLVPHPVNASRQLCPDDASVSTLCTFRQGDLEGIALHAPTRALREERAPPSLVLGSALLSPPYPVRDNEDLGPITFSFSAWLPGNPALRFL